MIQYRHCAALCVVAALAACGQQDARTLSAKDAIGRMDARLQAGKFVKSAGSHAAVTALGCFAQPGLQAYRVYFYRQGSYLALADTRSGMVFATDGPGYARYHWPLRPGDAYWYDDVEPSLASAARAASKSGAYVITGDIADRTQEARYQASFTSDLHIAYEHVMTRHTLDGNIDDCTPA